MGQGPSFDELIAKAIAAKASDLHLKAGSPPCIRVDGQLHVLGEYPSLTAEDTERLAQAIVPPRRRQEFEQLNEADFAYTWPDGTRFRVNAFRQRGAAGVVLRRVIAHAPQFAELSLPPAVQRLADEQRGLVLVTGPTGAGKTTTLAAMIDHINRTRRCNIVTIEDPIEVLHQDKLSLINQREIGNDTEDYHSALRRVLRQDPDVIFIGEVRDRDAAWAGLAAAETGHLVLSTLHTRDATETINRFIDLFPQEQQRHIRVTLASSLRGVVSQRLLERADGKGRVPAVEVLINTGRVFDRIMDPAQTHLIPQVIVEGEYYGMQTFDQSLFQLYKNGMVSLRDALAAASDPHDFRILLSQAGLISHQNAIEGPGAKF